MQPTKCFALLVRITMAQHLPLIIVWDLHDCKQMRVGWHYCVHCSAEQMCFENRVHYISIKLHKVQMWRNESIYVSVKDKAITEKKKKKNQCENEQQPAGIVRSYCALPGRPALLVPDVWLHIALCITLPGYVASVLSCLCYTTE
jgi:hypothetical protein